MILQLQGVTKYYQSVKALDTLHLQVKPGAIGLLGPNGAGKSTLIKILMGLVKPSLGEASVLGYNVRTHSREIRERVGYMPEDDCYLQGLAGVQSVAFVGELAGLPPNEALRRSHEMLDYVGIDEERYREVQTYSTGMKQKIRLAQALIHSPQIVFLDEPTSGLDPQGRERMLRLIKNLAEKKGVSVVFSTHILHDVESCCDAVIILGRGRLLVYDTLVNLQQTRSDEVIVRIDGDMTVFMQGLASQQVQVTQLSADSVSVKNVGERASDMVFGLANEQGIAIRSFETSKTSLEQIFLNAVREGQKNQENNYANL